MTHITVEHREAAAAPAAAETASVSVLARNEVVLPRRGDSRRQEIADGEDRRIDNTVTLSSSGIDNSDDIDRTD